MRADQPRVCGEKGEQTARPHYHMGSPPHMRGKELSALFVCPRSGITPAHAGKSLTIPKLTTRSWDHPRTCGEKDGCGLPRLARWGSPPHMRGKAKASTFRVKSRGITPAHAGKSSRQAARQVPAGDHPRTCGEKPCVCFWSLPLMGSPPHMRGKGSTSHCVPSLYGITPAHAGKSFPVRKSVSW